MANGDQPAKFAKISRRRGVGKSRFWRKCCFAISCFKSPSGARVRVFSWIGKCPEGLTGKQVGKTSDGCEVGPSIRGRGHEFQCFW